MASLSNPRHERFAQALAQGHSASEAYEKAGYKPNRQAASRLLSKVDICDRVTELQDKHIERDEDNRSRIQAENIIKRLTDHVLGNLKDEDGQTIALESSQVTAALGLLKKVLPDLSSTNVQGDVFNYHYVVDAEPVSEDEWENQYANGVAAPAGTTESTH